MGRYSPTVLPDDRDDPALAAFLDELAKGPERYQQQRAGRRADVRAEREGEQYDYERSQRPLEQALRAAQLHEQGIVGPGAPMPTLPSGVGAPPARGGELPRPGRQPFLEELMQDQGPQLPAGAFNPMTGSFQTPQLDRVDLGGGYQLDESRTPRGRQMALAIEDERRLTQAGIPAGIAAYAAQHPENAQQILSTFLERQQPSGGWKPQSKAEQLEIIRAQNERTRQARDNLVMPMDKAFEEVDNMYAIAPDGGPWRKGDVMIGHRLNPGARARMASQIARGDFDWETAPKTIRPGSRAAMQNANALTGRQTFSREEIEEAPDAGLEQPQLTVEAARRIVARYPDLDDDDLTDALTHHGFTEAQIEQALAGRRRPLEK